MHATIRTALFLSALAFATPAAVATPFIGSAGDFAVLGLAGGNVIINSSTSIAGNVGYSANVTSNTNQKVDSFTGTAYVHSTAAFTHTPATFAPSGGIVSGGAADALLDAANADALSAAATLAGLSPTHASLGALGDGDNVTVNSVGALNVISIDSLIYKEDTFTINGNAGDVFVFNVSGGWNFASSEIVLNGVNADDVIFNFLSATTEDIKINKADTVFQGTILAANRYVDYHNPATFNGRIIALEINIHSDFNIAAPETTPEVAIPAPGIAALFGLAATLLGAARRREPRPA